MLFSRMKLDFSLFPPGLPVPWDLDLCSYVQLHWRPLCCKVFSFRVLCIPSPICVPSNAASQTGFDWHHSVWISVIGKYLILISFCLSFIAVAGSYVSSFFLNVAVFLLSAIANILNTWTCLLISACILALSYVHACSIMSHSLQP